MDSAYFNGPETQELKENPKYPYASFSSTNHSSASPTLKDISNRNFSLNEILPISPSDSKNSHRRFNSQTSEILHPRNLFSTKSSSSSRNSFDNISKKLNSFKKNLAMHDLDEFNTTRSVSSVIKKNSELPKIFVNVSHNMRFCENCDKIVQITEESFDGNQGNAKVFQMFCVLVACWEPKFVQQYKNEICEECGKIIL